LIFSTGGQAVRIKYRHTPNLAVSATAGALISSGASVINFATIKSKSNDEIWTEMDSKKLICIATFATVRGAVSGVILYQCGPLKTFWKGLAVQIFSSLACGVVDGICVTVIRKINGERVNCKSIVRDVTSHCVGQVIGGMVTFLFFSAFRRLVPSGKKAVGVYAAGITIAVVASSFAGVGL
jgi:hypothetical protein